MELEAELQLKRDSRAPAKKADIKILDGGDAFNFANTAIPVDVANLIRLASRRNVTSLLDLFLDGEDGDYVFDCLVEFNTSFHHIQDIFDHCAQKAQAERADVATVFFAAMADFYPKKPNMAAIARTLGKEGILLSAETSGLEGKWLETYKQFLEDFKGIDDKKIIRDQLNVVFAVNPRSPENMADHGASQYYFIKACWYLLNKQFEDLDPVIGDEACEARPPFIIDMWFKLDKAQKASGETPETFVKWFQFYEMRHRKYGSEEGIDRVESWSTKQIVDFFHTVFTEKEREYLGAAVGCVMSGVMFRDEWGLESFERARAMKPEDKERFRNILGAQSTENVLIMARALRDENETVELFKDIVKLLEGVEALREGEAKRELAEEEAKQDAGGIRCLPIYETMRTVLAWEFKCDRPIMLSIWQIKCTESEKNTDGVAAQTPLNRNARYECEDVTILYLRPNSETGKYEYCEAGEDWKDRPMVHFKAYHLVNDKDPIEENVHGPSLAPIGDDYIHAIKEIDFGVLLQCYAAVHPPIPHKAELWIGHQKFLSEQHVAAIEGFYREELGQEQGERLFDENGLSRKNISFSLMRPEYRLQDEYFALSRIGDNACVKNKQYIIRCLGDDWAHEFKTQAYRSLESCAFSIHHIHVETPAQMQKNRSKYLEKRELPRFHNFDRGGSSDFEKVGKL